MPDSVSTRLADATGLLLAWLHGRGLSFQQPRSRASRRIPVLGFHRVATIRPDHWMTIAPDVFERLVRALQSRYRIVSLAEVERLLESGADIEPAIALSFDDA